MKHTHKTDVYSIVTNRIIELLERGVIPWRQPWTEAGHPKNLLSKKNYRGINVWLLASLHYPQNYFLTFRQAKELGGTVKKGEKSCPVIYWNWSEKEDAITKEEEKIPFLRYYSVFNISQCEGIPMEKLPPAMERQNEPLQSCEEIIENMPSRPEIRHREHRAFYNRENDFVNMPERKTFISSESYYATLFHELAHSTGHKARLNRQELMESNGFNSKEYAIEELTAEMGASYLKSHAGISIEKLEDNAAYIQHWLERLKKDRKFIIHASAQAQKAVDFILGVKNQELEMELTEELSKECNMVGMRIEEMERIRGRKKEREVERGR